MSNDILNQFGIQDEPKSDRESALKQAVEKIDSIIKKQKVEDLLTQFGIDDNMRETIGDRIISTIEDAKKIGSDLLEQFSIIDGDAKKEGKNPDLVIEGSTVEVDVTKWLQSDSHNNIIAGVDVVTNEGAIAYYDHMPAHNGWAEMSSHFRKAGPREVNIRPMNNGFIVQVGCQSFVFESFMSMLTSLEMYYRDPEGTEKLFNEGKLFKK